MKRSFYERYLHTKIKDTNKKEKKKIKIKIDLGGFIEIIWHIILTILLSIGATVVLNIIISLVFEK